MTASKFVVEIEPGRWRGTVSGHEYDHRNIDAADALERKAKEALQFQTRSNEEIAFENLPADKVRVLIEREMMTNQQLRDSEALGDVLGTWMALHPEYLDTPYNSSQMVNYFRLRDLRTPSINDFDTAFLWLSGQSLLQLDAKVLTEQKRKDWEKRANEIREQAPLTEDEMYALPLEEVERRARNSYVR